MWYKIFLASTMCASIVFGEDLQIACDKACAQDLSKKLQNTKNPKAISHNPFVKQEIAMADNDDKQEQINVLVLEAIMNKRALISGSWYPVGQTPYFVILHIAQDSITINKNGHNARIKISEQIGL